MHQRQVSVHVLEPGVFVLQFTQLRQVRNCHARVLAFPFVIGGLTHAVLPACLADLGTQLDLLEDGNDLAFTESGFLHVETPMVGILYSQLAQVSEGASHRHQVCLRKKVQLKKAWTRTPSPIAQAAHRYSYTNDSDRAICVTSNNVSDAAVLLQLLAQVPTEKSRLAVTRDGHYDI